MRRRRWLLVAALVAALAAVHAVAVWCLFPVAGTAANWVSVIVAGVAAVWFGWRVGVGVVALNALSSAIVFGHIYHVSDPHGRIKGVVAAAVFAGITIAVDKVAGVVRQRRVLREELFHAKKMEAVGRLAGGVAHDINNTLNAIMGSVFALRQELSAYNRAFPDLDNIAAACDQGAQLTRALLGFARKSVFKHQVVSLGDVAESVAALAARARNAGVRIRVHRPSAPALVRGDRSQLENAVMNVCLNAVDASAPGEVVDMAVTADGDRVRLVVRDRGVGMPAEVRERVFEPFFTTKEEGRGTGLGMAMVYGVVQAMQGAIRVESAPGKGTDVTMTFPAAALEEGEGDARKVRLESVPPASSDLAGKTVLIADDDALVLRVGVRVLRKLGCRVMTAADGNQVVDLVEREAVDLCIVDWIMPGMHGGDVIAAVRKSHPRLPIIVVSGYTYDRGNIEEVLAHHEDVVFLAKPYQPQELLTAVGDLLALGEAEAASRCVPS